VNKDDEMKRNPQYHMSHLRGRVDSAVKGTHEDVDELKGPQWKVMVEIPVTGSGSGIEGSKYYNNKMIKKF